MIPFGLARAGSPATGYTPLLIGQFVTAQIQGRTLEASVALPRAALYEREKVYVLDEDNRTIVKTVAVIHKSDDYVWIDGQISEGERVIVEKQSLLAPGRVVSPIVDSQVVMNTDMEVTP